MAVTHEEARRAQMKAVVKAYFEGIVKQDMSAVPYDDNVLLRSPLAPGGLEHSTARATGSVRLVRIPIVCPRGNGGLRALFQR